MTGPPRLHIPRRLRFTLVTHCMSGAALAVVGSAGADTTVYRHEDAQGIVVFADRPGIERQEVTLSAVNTYTPTASKEPATAPPRADAAGTYRSLFITGPENGETVRRNGGNVRVTGRIEPDLRADDSAVLLMDGAVLMSLNARPERAAPFGQPHGDIEFALAGIARGPHTLRISIRDQENNPLIESAPVSFHLLRAAAGRRQ